ncbi:hypothetical protein ACIRL0_00505 [Streptomyces sp. NPDC102365]|uniref:hypothetical protein n=1 Tax=Streptomyces sp. NPDC102365 TaxID=3366162 RepID=UPI0037F23DC0
MNALIPWAQSHTIAAAVAAGLLLVALVWLARAIGKAANWPPVAVTVAAVAALACTAYSADTSWSFAEHALGMVDTTERAGLFLAGELALFACALMARQNLRGPQKAPGTPGLLVWFITAVQVIPAYYESGFVGGTVRAVLGPVMAALLWHLAMGIELRHGKPGDASQSLPAILGRELRERLLSRLGLATRDRSAEQITRDRATARAVELAARPKLRRWGKARLAAAVARAEVGTNPEQLDVMMQQLAARRGASELHTVQLLSPFVPREPEVTVEVHRVPDVPEVYPAIEVRVPAVPEAVPPACCLLPLATPCGLPPAVPEPVAEVPVPEPVPAHGYPVPERPDRQKWEEPIEGADEDQEPEDDQGYPDPLLSRVRADFPGEVPGVRRLRETYRIGQPRAQRIRDQLAEVTA